MTPCYVVGWFSEGKDRPSWVRPTLFATRAEAETDAAFWDDALSYPYGQGEYRALLLTDPAIKPRRRTIFVSDPPFESTEWLLRDAPRETKRD